jgi:hypothetical protein
MCEFIHTPDKPLDHKTCSQKQPGVLAPVNRRQALYLHLVSIAILNLPFRTGCSRRLVGGGGLQLNGCCDPHFGRPHRVCCESQKQSYVMKIWKLKD